MITKHATTRTGVETILDVVQVYDIQPSQDGLEFASPSAFDKWKIESVSMPERLEEFLTDIRLLRRVPLSYLVPDPNLLPPESIRFFHVDQTWVDRVIDGVFSATNIGTVDFHYSLTTLQLVRDSIDPAPTGMTGVLIRSELVRRWPKMIVRAFSGESAGVDDESTMPVLRAEALSRDIFIALFASRPKRIHIREPFEGVRYGVEGTQFPYKVDKRDTHGEAVSGNVSVAARDISVRTINVDSLKNSLAAGLKDSRGVALHLEQRPYVQIFLDTVDEPRGSIPPPQDNLVLLRNGKLFKLDFVTQALFQASE